MYGERDCHTTDLKVIPQSHVLPDRNDQGTVRERLWFCLNVKTCLKSHVFI